MAALLSLSMRRRCAVTTLSAGAISSNAAPTGKGHALRAHCSDFDALKLERATGMDHVAPAVQNLLRLAKIDHLASANQVAASTADVVHGNEVVKPAFDE